MEFRGTRATLSSNYSSISVTCRKVGEMNRDQTDIVDTAALNYTKVIEKDSKSPRKKENFLHWIVISKRYRLSGWRHPFPPPPMALPPALHKYSSISSKKVQICYLFLYFCFDIIDSNISHQTCKDWVRRKTIFRRNSSHWLTESA